MTGTCFITDNAKAYQRRTMLAQLRIASVTTVDARHYLGVSHPSGRVKELKSMGFDIRTHRLRTTDAMGRPTTCALYELFEPPEVHQHDEAEEPTL